LDTSRAPPALGMFTIMQQEANLKTKCTGSDARLQEDEYDATDDENASFCQKDRLFKKVLHGLAAGDQRVSKYLSTLHQDQQCMPSILDFEPSAQCDWCVQLGENMQGLTECALSADEGIFAADDNCWKHFLGICIHIAAMHVCIYMYCKLYALSGIDPVFRTVAMQSQGILAQVLVLHVC